MGVAEGIIDDTHSFNIWMSAVRWLTVIYRFFLNYSNLLRGSAHVDTWRRRMRSFGDWIIDSNSASVDLLVIHGFFGGLRVFLRFVVDERKTAWATGLKIRYTLIKMFHQLLLLHIHILHIQVRIVISRIVFEFQNPVKFIIMLWCTTQKIFGL